MTQTSRIISLVTGFLLVGLFNPHLVQAETSLSADLVEAGWEEITFDDKRPNRHMACGADCIRVETDQSVSMIGRPVSVDLTANPVLHWEWRIDRPVVESDLSRKGGDDRAIAVYVAFTFDPDDASFGELLLRPIVELAQGADAPGRGISYAWAGYGEVGDTFESPYQEDSAAITMQRTGTDPVGEWLSESVNVVEAYRRVFGVDPVGVTHILLSADSDDTGNANGAEVRNLRFTPSGAT